MKKKDTVFLYACDDSTECSSIKVILHRGYWKLECWGASGGNASKALNDKIFEGGKGGYSVGVVKVTSEDEEFYI